MPQMTKRERIFAALAKKDVDKVPFSIWYHIPHVDQDPRALAEKMVELNNIYDCDFIKMMPFGNYVAVDFGLSCNYYCDPHKPVFERKWGIDCVDDWYKLEPLPATYGTYGKVLQTAQQTAKIAGDVPFVQTIFAPLTTAKKLAGPAVFEYMRSNPEALHHALQAIMETTLNFVKANAEAGVTGFFFATQTASKDLLSAAEYAEFENKYNEPIMKLATELTKFNIIHIHGPNTYFEELVKLPSNAINWHDRWIDPPVEEARKITDKCLLGGIHEKWLTNADTSEIYDDIHAYVKRAGREGLIVTPGCCLETTCPEANKLAMSIAVHSC